MRDLENGSKNRDRRRLLTGAGLTLVAPLLPVKASIQSSNHGGHDDDMTTGNANDARLAAAGPPPTLAQARTGAATDSVENKMREAVSVKDFGAVGDGVSNDTAAINLAISTGKNIFFPPGKYRTMGGHVLNTVGQHFVGAGRSDGRLVGGTVLSKISGTAATLTLKQTDHYVADITFDGNAVGGNQLVLDAAKYSQVERLCFRGQGGNDFALKLHSLSGGATVNLCSFRDLNFLDGNYGAIDIDHCLYTTFHGISTGAMTGGISIDIGARGANTISIDFFHTYVDSQIRIHDASQSIRFFGLQQEAITATSCLDIAGANTQDVEVIGYRVLRNASTQPIVSIAASARSITLQGLRWQDTGSLPGQEMIQLDSANDIRIRDASIRSANAFTFVECTGTRSDHVTLENCYAHSGGVGTNVFKCASLVVIGGNLFATFARGTGSCTLIQPGAAYDTANIGTDHFTAIGRTGTDADHLSALTVAGHYMKPPSYVQSTEPAIAANGFAVWRDTAASKTYLISSINGVQKKIELT